MKSWEQKNLYKNTAYDSGLDVENYEKLKQWWIVLNLGSLWLVLSWQMNGMDLTICFQTEFQGGWKKFTE